ncbi:MAG: hypothetical protein EOS56_02650 [Mesorhizobium sp.]|nr:MAG: hypothetical protein EOS55_12475 [Mesorhizobium sp.]RWC64591.1 MAG: hypothetical protein EOS56_02650 [Mesorhizobium sp.]RWC67329.1 MAG: hypothetical protein EOS29_00250 [Mesorhizobium sp.]
MGEAAAAVFRRCRGTNASVGIPWRPPLSCRTSPPRVGRSAAITAFAICRGNELPAKLPIPLLVGVEDWAAKRMESQRLGFPNDERPAGQRGRSAATYVEDASAGFFSATSSAASCFSRATRCFS